MKISYGKRQNQSPGGKKNPSKRRNPLLIAQEGKRDGRVMVRSTFINFVVGRPRGSFFKFLFSL